MNSDNRQVGIIGGGRMGSGIAHAFLIAGTDVVLVEVDAVAATAAEARVSRYLERSTTIEQSHLGRTGRLVTVTSVMGVAECGLVVEAAPEEFGLKRRLLAEAERVCPRDAILTTNTSSISVDALTESLTCPERFAGLHFFNPVPVSELVEIVVGSRTAPWVVGYLQSTVARIGKQTIVVRDSPGFASSRLGVALALEAMLMVEEGIASPADIDRAMTLGYRHSTGPLATSDLVGLDVRLGIAEYLASTLGSRFQPPKILKQLVVEGRLGRKSGRGFFEWE
ncbi:3-hydroxyacyl-CoA dehydrogenase family protein [Rhizomonospora bruguierae]|uniref:3-hydroxyacyl-CoA dehydrogenase family protein n=1 Tax=Rhizomonospora bruguierae TaxID=1581705 RepID=UPI001BCB9454|nr:3-hydroxyacyl-CoA dehydrogenase family protein [Micromonospora sp. NBRC 107566]